MYVIGLSATPRQVAADGASAARLRIDLKDQRGRSVPDGTQFVVRTDLGLVSGEGGGRQSAITARTSGGFAIVFVTSTAPGTATVTVQAADTRAVIYLDFLPEGEAAQPEARVADVSAGWVGYSIDLQLIEARDRAQVKFGKLIIECGGVLQINTEDLTLKAQDVIIHRGDVTLAGEDLYFDLGAKRGVLRRFGEERLERVFFDAITLKPTQTEWEIPYDAFRVNKQETDNWLVAKSISLFLHEKIVLRNCAFWVQDQKVFSFPPYWIIGLPGYTGATNTQAFGLTSDGGLAIDFPFFYRVTDKATGAIRIQRGAPSGSVISRDGWSFAVAEEYRNGTGVEGSAEISGLPRSDWGFEWRDSRPMFNNGFGYFNFALPDHRSIFTDTNIYSYRAGGRVGLRAYYDKPIEYRPSWGAVSDYLSDSRQIGDHSLNYRLGTSLGLRQYQTEASPVFINQVYSELSLGERRWGKKTTLSPLFTNIYNWDSSGYKNNDLRGELRLDHKVTPSCAVTLDYSAQWRRTTDENDLRSGVTHTIGFDLRANRGSKWLTYLSSSFDLTNQNTYGYLNFDYYLNSLWRCGLRGTYYDFDSSDYQDLEFSLGRLFGSREVSLTYSAQSGRVSLNLGGFGFR